MGIKRTFNISCSHNLGINKLVKFLFQNNKYNQKNLFKNNEKEEISIGIYGKPNAGKSTLVNTFLGFNRFQTGNLSGITTDTIPHNIKYKNKLIKIFDTAGIKPNTKINSSLESTASLLSISNISKCQDYPSFGYGNLGHSVVRQTS